ncbi:SGT1 protein-domain-containing protein [Kalaharituber pfeilii]|nr:SGT1 protein-domain-containing protein [Kalaharituber pfeilii]
MDPFTPGYGEFQGIPKRTLPDDTVQYSIYILQPGHHLKTQLKSKLEDVRKAATKLVHDWGEDYIWQRDEFKLEFQELEGLPYLYGETEFGDSIEDEWFIVAILRELSKNFPELWIRVADNDGEFLLIEAANALPSWVKPEIMDNRVWINSGQLVLLAEKNATTAITLKTALDMIRSSNKQQIQRIRLIEEEAFYRVSKFPAAARDHLHYGLAKIPRKVALILRERPQYISAAVEQFYLRDPISLKACKAMRIFDPSDSVTVSVRFTKVLYAQLRSQDFDPPAGVGFTIPVRPQGGAQSKEFIAADVGMKVACGFEMLVDSEIKSKKEEAIADDIRKILSSKIPPTDTEISTWSKRDDPDNWLDIDYNEFDQNLQGKSGKQQKPGIGKIFSGYGHKAAEENLKKMVERFEKFLNDENAGFDGVELDEDDEPSDDEDSSDEDEDEDAGVSFDEAEFERMMREMMGLPSDEKSDRADEEEEIRRVMSQVEAELKEEGVIEAVERPRVQEVQEGDSDIDEDGSDVNIDFNLAKNILESFKSQGGMAGPGGNLLASMGIALPRDEGESDMGGPKRKGKGKERLD